MKYLTENLTYKTLDQTLFGGKSTISKLSGGAGGGGIIAVENIILNLNKPICNILCGANCLLN